MAQKQRSHNDDIDIEVVDENNRNQCEEELETAFTPIQKLEVLSNLLLN